ncbi:MAG: ribonuclease H-like domain-containing protein [Thermodesulfobacteria bacterium]|nr:ribonuclease H-like domain-containing protein [Thermodesulfobacteriota bacterium]
MLYRTFLLLPGVDEKTERHLWQAGCRTWWHLLARDSLPRLSGRRLRLLQDRLCELIPSAKDLDTLAARLPRRHHWRLFKHFRREAVFLDIETDGLRRGEHEVTVLGLATQEGYFAYVAGENLEEGLQRLKEARFWITFGGSFFDWPFLKSRYPWLSEPLVHLDLCPLFKRLGLKGGLKKIEKALGLGRPEEVDGFDGYMAVKLWRLWRRRGDAAALERLITYNREDVMNLIPLAEILYSGLTMLALTGKIPALSVSSREDRRRRACDGQNKPI